MSTTRYPTDAKSHDADYPTLLSQRTFTPLQVWAPGHKLTVPPKPEILANPETPWVISLANCNWKHGLTFMDHSYQSTKLGTDYKLLLGKTMGHSTDKTVIPKRGSGVPWGTANTS
jgi:hypothetical protein